MILRVILLFISFVLIESAYEGDYCVKDGTAGVCKNLNRCSTAIQDIMNKRNPQICSFEKTALIVCCLDGRVQNPVATTKRPSVKYTTEFVPPLYEYESIDQSSGVSGCAPIDASLTSKKTGQKAFDKCIEYQEKYVYPCERGVSLLGDLSRSNNCHHNVDELIIGGTDAAQYEFPHMVMLGVGNNMDQVHWLCGGALVSEKFILTAGHCVTNRQFGPAKYALIGALKRSDDADKSKIYKVKNNIFHPDYQPPSKYNDIALIETETPIKLSQFIVPACLHAGDAVNDSRVLATGWGNVKFNQTIPANTLQKVILDKFSTSECSRTYKPVKKMKRGFDGSSQLCYGDKSVTKDTSLGDSGGPIQIKSKKVQCMYTVVGVTSFGSSFVGRPAIYTRVSSYIPWIESIVWPN